ncbi:MAG: 2-oxoglutarate dehydrogenase E1 component [Mariprofundales bacterium]
MTQNKEENIELQGISASFIEAMYADYVHDPHSVPSEWADYFGHDLEQKPATINANTTTDNETSLAHMPLLSTTYQDAHTTTMQQVEYPSRALYLINAYRRNGHMQATLDPLELHDPLPSPELELGYYGLADADLNTHFPTGDLAGPPRMRLHAMIALLRKTYCGNIGPEFSHLNDSAQRHWLQNALESNGCTPQFDGEQRRHIFQNILHASEFERFLHTRYAGQKRFSLEGGESLIVMLDALLQKAGDKGVREIILGMAHRGRLSVLANILGKDLSEIFAEFEGVQFEDAEHASGDVKYHMGFSADIATAGGIVHLSLAFNPSHLEVVTPVIEGSVRARQCRRRDTLKREVMSVIIHGDAAFAGQGVVAESLNLSKLRGFRTGGTIHIIVNNQIGFTTNPYDARSSLYCTDIAKMVQAPIFHVNGDDPEAAAHVCLLAMEFRHRFKQDVIIDLVCYRRHGHNEADEPSVTQPAMYRRIQKTPILMLRYADLLIQEGLLTRPEVQDMVQSYRAGMDQIRRDNSKKKESRHLQQLNSLHGRWQGYTSEGATEPETAVSAERLESLARKVHILPTDFVLHPKVEKIYNNRMSMMRGELAIDWGCAETMAYATLLDEGGWIRVSGQDSGRSTFFHRHAMVYDQHTGRGYMPLQQAENGRDAHFIVIDSMLSEQAVLGYEYGYSVAEPRALVIWEAQYGDFANNAQVIIDQFISSSEVKWQRMSGIIMWLPHGYEGQGPEHSSARLERYLQLCAENNMQVCMPTTPAQLFHLLRRQSRIRSRKPLIFMAPKSMLRQKASFSELADFTNGIFQPVLPEIAANIMKNAENIKRVVLCSGKVYYDLLAERQKCEITDITIIRIERLYPFPTQELQTVLQSFTAMTELIWLQEEPANQGAWYQIRDYLQAICQYVRHVSRPASASPAVGSAKRHKEQQAQLVKDALTIS